VSTYSAPLKDMSFAIRELAGLSEISALPGCAEVNPELVDAVLVEAA
jgi:3-(methylthio)propanoyl-CoA dehydrogenase